MWIYSFMDTKCKSLEITSDINRFVNFVSTTQTRIFRISSACAFASCCTILIYGLSTDVANSIIASHQRRHRIAITVFWNAAAHFIGIIFHSLCEMSYPFTVNQTRTNCLLKCYIFLNKKSDFYPFSFKSWKFAILSTDITEFSENQLFGANAAISASSML